VDPTSVTAAQELLVEGAVFAEVLAEVQEDPSPSLLKVNLISSNAIGTVVDCE